MFWSNSLLGYFSRISFRLLNFLHKVVFDVLQLKHSFLTFLSRVVFCWHFRQTNIYVYVILCFFFQLIGNLCICWVRAEVTHVSTWSTTRTLLHSYDCCFLSKILNVLEVKHVWTGMCKGFLQSGHFFINALNWRSYIGEASAVALIGWVKAGGSLSCVSKECRYLGYRLSHTFWGVILDMWLTNEHKGITERSLVCFWGGTIAETLKRRSWAGETNCCCEQVSKFSRQIIDSSVLKWGDDTANWSSTAFSSE